MFKDGCVCCTQLHDTESALLDIDQGKSVATTEDKPVLIEAFV